MTEDPTELRILCESLARSAGGIASLGRRAIDDRNRFDAGTKSSTTDVVTEYDEAAERHVVDAIRRLRPGDGIVGEEGTNHIGDTGFAWYIDPIDGTTNFVYGQPAWSCSVAVAREGEMVAGAVYVPPLDEMFSAGIGQGATRDGRSITASGQDDLALALVGTGFGYQPEQRREQAAVVARLIGDVRDIRRLGSAAVDLCMVACGRLDVYYERGLNSWDAAAGELIAREAGAVTSDFDGGPARPEAMVAAAPGVHAAFLQLLAAG